MSRKGSILGEGMTWSLSDAEVLGIKDQVSRINTQLDLAVMNSKNLDTHALPSRNILKYKCSWDNVSQKKRNREKTRCIRDVMG